MLGGQVNDPEILFSSVPSSNSLSWTLEGLFELTRCSSGDLDLPHALLLEVQKYKDTVRCGSLGAEVSRHRQEQQKKNLDCAFVENATLDVFVVLEIGGAP